MGSSSMDFASEEGFDSDDGAYLTEEMEATEINTFLFKNGIAVSHLVKRKPSLEQQFLDLTNIK